MDAQTTAPIDTLIVEPEETVRRDLHTMLGQFTDIRVVGEAATCKAAIKEVSRLKPVLILMDVSLLDKGGIMVTSAIKELVYGSRVIMFTCRDTDEDAFLALAAGADGFCLNNGPLAWFMAGIRWVLKGDVWIHPWSPRPLFSSGRRQRRTSRTKSRWGRCANE
jgi:DNA-binding NarL/FixJ family response regulator